LELGAWDMPTRASAMELNIPGIHGVGDSLVYFVDRHGDFSIYDVDFVPLAGADPGPPAIAGLHYFGVVQAILVDRTADWLDFYRSLFGFSVLPQGQYFGVLPRGTLLESPCRKFYLQLIEPPPGSEEIHWDEALVRLGLGARDVPAATRALQERGIAFVDRGPVQASGLRVTGFQVLRDFEGLSGHLHAYKVDVAKAMLRMCRALGSEVLLACSSTSAHAAGDPESLIKDLQKLAMLAVPLNIRIAYEALSWGRHVNEFPQAAELVQRADRANLGLALDSFHIFANKTRLDALQEIDPAKVFLVQPSEFMWEEIRSPDDRIETARHYRA